MDEKYGKPLGLQSKVGASRRLAPTGNEEKTPTMSGN